MSIKSFFEEKTKKMDWLDIGLIKWSCIFFGVVIAMLIPEITKINVWWFVGLFVVLAIRPFYRVYFK